MKVRGLEGTSTAGCAVISAKSRLAWWSHAFLSSATRFVLIRAIIKRVPMDQTGREVVDDLLLHAPPVHEARSRSNRDLRTHDNIHKQGSG